MRNRPLLLALLLLAGCQTPPAPYSPVSEVAYAAIGANPLWMVAIGDDAIVLTLGAEDQSGGPRDLHSHAFARTLPRVTDGVTRWESGEGTEVIAIEARPGPCTGARGPRYEDSVTVSLSGRQLSGCGGRIIGRGRR